MKLVAPLVFPDGSTQSTASTGGGGGGGSLSAIEVTLDFGSSPVMAKTFAFSAPGATTLSKVIMMQSGKPASGRSSDENEMDAFTCAAYCDVNGQITAYISALPGPVTGQYVFNYVLG